MSLSREQALALLPFLANGSLDDAERAEAEAAVAADTTLAAELRMLSAIRARMQAQEAPPGPGELGLARLMRDVDAETAQAAPSGGVPVARLRVWQAAAVAFLAVGIGQFALAPPDFGAPEAEQTTFGGLVEEIEPAAPSASVPAAQAQEEREGRQMAETLDVLADEAPGAPAVAAVEPAPPAPAATRADADTPEIAAGVPLVAAPRAEGALPPVFRVVFAAGSSEAQIRALLIAAGLQIVGGPSTDGQYELGLRPGAAGVDAARDTLAAADWVQVVDAGLD